MPIDFERDGADVESEAPAIPISELVDNDDTTFEEHWFSFAIITRSFDVRRNEDVFILSENTFSSSVDSIRLL